MPDIATIGSVLTSIKAATDIAKLIKESDSSLDKAETKLRVAELIGALADVKLEVADLQDLIREKEAEIHGLNEQLKAQDELSYDGMLYRKEGDDIPFCSVCFEKDNKHHHVIYSPSSDYYRDWWECKICENKFYPK